MKNSKKGLSILVIPDSQVKAGVPLDHLRCLGHYIMSKRPDVIVNIGDFADMESLSSYDAGKKSFEGRRYKTDIEVARKAMDLLLEPMRQYNRKRSLATRYRPRMIMTLGNHEERIVRAIEADPKLDGTISVDDLGYKEAGWEVYPFLVPVVVNGIAFAHYFTSGVMGRPVASASQLLNKRHQSAVMGHVQRREIAFATKADGTEITALFAGTCYQHDEKYLGPQGQGQYRGVWMLYNCRDGQYEPVPVPLQFLLATYQQAR